VLRRALKELRDGILSIAYPEDCRICSRPVESYDDGVVCSACWSNETLTGSLCEPVICFKCGVTLIEPSLNNGQLQNNRQQVCGTCAAVPFTFARACGPYTGALEANILFLKTRPHICTRLRSIVAETVIRHREALAADVVIPVPLHRLRERARGFNQAAIIAKRIATDFGLRLDDRSLVRIKDTERHRAGMDVVDRRRSVAGAFEVVRPRVIEGAAVLLVDDVYTTGSTVSSAAEALAEAGADRVSVFTVSRVVDRKMSLQSTLR
jgi:ComF family protein